MNHRLIYFLFCFVMLISQNSRIDSLYQSYSDQKTFQYSDAFFEGLSNGDVLSLLILPDSRLKVNALNRLAYNYTFNNIDSAKFFIKRALTLAEKNNLETQEANSFYILGKINEFTGRFSDAITNHLNALEIGTRIQDQYIIAKSHYEIGECYFQGKNYTDAYKNYKSSYQIYESLNELYWLGQINFSLGNLFLDAKNFKNSKDYYWQSIVQFDSLNNVYELIKVHWKMYESETKQGNFDEAENILSYALTLSLKQDSRFEIARSYRAFAKFYYEKNELDSSRVYFEKAVEKYAGLISVDNHVNHEYANTLVDLNEFDLAESYHQKGYKVSLATQNKIAISNSSFEYAKFYRKTNKIDLSLEFALKAFNNAFDVQMTENLKDCAELLSNLYTEKKDYKNAFLFEKEYQKYFRIYDANQHLNELSQMEFEQELQKEKIEIDKQKLSGEKELFINRVYVYMLLFLSLLLIVILIYIYFYFKNKENTKRLELSEQTANIGYWELNLITNEMIWSDHFIKIFNNVSIPNPNLDSFLKLFVEKNRVDLENIFKAILEKRKNIDLELFTIYGKRVRLLIRYQSRDKSKVYGIIHDITSQFEYEQKVKKSELKFRGIFDVSPFGMAIVDVDGFVRQVNQSFSNFVGLPKSKILHTLYPKLVIKKSIPSLNQHIEDLIEGRSDHFIIEQQFKDKNGASNWALMHVLLIKNQNEPDYFIVQIVDINEKHNNEIEREQLIKRVSTKNQELESFIYVTSHDLRSPLVNIQGFSNEIIESFDDLENLVNDVENKDLREKLIDLIQNDIKDSLSYIKAGSSKIDQLLAGLLKLSRLGRVKLDSRILNMNELMTDILKTFQFQIKEYKAEVVVDDLPEIVGDYTQLNQAFSNLIDNAFKYRELSRTLRIHIFAKKSKDKVMYCIKDNGKGIDENHQKKVFELFHRLNPNEDIPGEGLGLSIIKRIADRHNGSIDIISAKDEGSTFILNLPIINER